MKTHYDLTDEEFEESFEKSEFPSELFTHEAHLRLAYIHIQNHGVKKAISNIRIQLKTYVTKLGASEKFHETLTVASVKAIYHFIKKAKTNTFKQLVFKYPELLTNFRELLQSHYSINIFDSKEARNKYLEPSLQSFD